MSCVNRDGIRVGIVGIGFGQQVLVPAFRLVPKFRVTAVAASSLQRAERIRSRLGLELAFGDWRALVESNMIDAIAVAVPPSFQPTVIRAGLNAGKPIFCEKPVAADFANALDVCEHVDRVGLPNMVDFWMPELPVWRQIIELLLSGEIGPIRHVAVQWNMETYDIRQQKISWKCLPEQGGGVLNSFVSHVLHYLELLFGPIDRIGCVLDGAPDLSGWVETLALLNGYFATGVPFAVSASSHTVHGNGHRLEIHGRHRTVVLENSDYDHAGGFKLWIGEKRSRNLREVGPSEAAVDHSIDGRIVPVSALLGRFGEWIETGSSSVPSLAQGLRVQALLNTARMSFAGKGVMRSVPVGGQVR